MDLAALEAVFAAPEKPRFFYCIPNFQNPTGKTMSLAKRSGRAMRLRCRYGVPVLEDDPYGELRIAGEPSAVHQKHGRPSGAVIYAGSFSKILCPGMRLAYCVMRQKADGQKPLWWRSSAATCTPTCGRSVYARPC